MIGHAVLCIGHEDITEDTVRTITSEDFPLKNGKGVLKIKDWDTISKKFIFIDDNFPVYQADSLDMPTKDIWIFQKVNIQMLKPKRKLIKNGLLVKSLILLSLFIKRFI